MSQTLKSEMAKIRSTNLIPGKRTCRTCKLERLLLWIFQAVSYIQHLTSDDFALKDGNAVQGIAYVIETYGIIYNKTILNDYCTMDNAVISSVDEINNFATLKAVADDIQARLDEINEKFGYDLQGAFTSAGMDGSSDWRFKTHLANLPIYYEYKDKGITFYRCNQKEHTLTITNRSGIYTLQIPPVIRECSPSKTGDEAESEFGMEEAVFYQNGTWEYGNLTNEENGYLVTADDMGMMPIYIGVEGEENQGLCTGSENYWCVNSKASAEDHAGNT